MKTYIMFMENKAQKNLHIKIRPCSENPVTQWYKDSLCNTKDRKFITRKLYKGQTNKTTK